MSRPLIGVTGPDRGGAATWLCTRFALWRAGARARRITPGRPRRDDALDGLVIGGGADVDPGLYGPAPSLADVVEASEPRHRDEGRSGRVLFPLLWVFRRLLSRKEASSSGDLGRDALEAELLESALADGRPVLGICRGAQLLNVVCGGTLHRDLASFYVEVPQLRTVLPRKRIEVERDSRLAAALETSVCLVNALHRQAVEELGEGIWAVAREENGVIQAVEHRHLPFVVGVQWHPEYLPQVRRQRRIFEHLVAAARRDRRAPGADDG